MKTPIRPALAAEREGAINHATPIRRGATGIEAADVPARRRRRRTASGQRRRDVSSLYANRGIQGAFLRRKTVITPRDMTSASTPSLLTPNLMAATVLLTAVGALSRNKPPDFGQGLCKPESLRPTIFRLTWRRVPRWK